MKLCTFIVIACLSACTETSQNPEDADETSVDSVHHAEEMSQGAEYEEATQNASMPSVLQDYPQYQDGDDPDLKTNSLNATLPFKTVSSAPLASVSIDVDTASYSLVRQAIESGRIPDKRSVRIEELLNNFTYHYQAPQTDQDFSLTSRVVESPWQDDALLLHLGIKAKSYPEDSGPRNFVFLIDVSGSMAPQLDLVKRSLMLLADNFSSEDRIALVTYAGTAQVLLENTAGSEKGVIFEAIASLSSGGSTNGASGLELAYHLAEKGLRADGINRLILATDGDFNVGSTEAGDLVESAKYYADQNIYLTILGYGSSYYGDERMEQISNDANGNYFNIDSEKEAQRVLLTHIHATLRPAAKDMKLQIEFNPRLVGSYRLIGYANRMMQDDQFNDDEEDAGDLGSGDEVTYLIEFLPPESEDFQSTYEIRQGVDPLLYQSRDGKLADRAENAEFATVRTRHKPPNGGESTARNFTVGDSVIPAGNIFEHKATCLALAVASFGLQASQIQLESLEDVVIFPFLEPLSNWESREEISEFASLVEKWQLLINRR